MKTTILILLLAFGMRGQSEPKWIQELANSSEKNKAQHYWASNIGTMLIGSTIYHYTERPGLSSLASGVLMFGVGAAKEFIWDGKMNRGVKSGGDIFMNGWGCLTGMIQVRVFIDIKQRKNGHNNKDN